MPRLARSPTSLGAGTSGAGRTRADTLHSPGAADRAPQRRRGTGGRSFQALLRAGTLVALLFLLTASSGIPGAQVADAVFYTSYVWAVQTVDSGIPIGVSTSLALDSAGLPHLAFLDPQLDVVRYARWTGENWSLEMVDEGHHFFGDVSLALDDADRPHLSYYSAELGFVWYATRNETAWTLHRVERGGSGGYSSLVLDSGGTPLIAYTYLNGRPRLATWNGTGWAAENVTAQAISAQHDSLALDATGRPHLAYYDSGSLYYAVREAAEWEVEVVDAEGNVGRFARLAVDTQNRPHVAYQDVGVDVLRYAVKVGDRWIQEVVDYQGDTGWDLDLYVDADDVPHIAYYERTEADLRYAVRTSLGWTSHLVDSTGVVGWFASLDLDERGLPHISYYDWSGGTIKYAHASLGAVVNTLEPLDVSPFTATVRGEVVSLGDFPSVNVSFQWRLTGASEWNATPPQPVATVGTVAVLLTNLTAEASYEYRIRGDMAGSTAYGDVGAFETPQAPEDGGWFTGLNRALLIGGAIAAVPIVLLLIWGWRRRAKRLRA